MGVRACVTVSACTNKSPLLVGGGGGGGVVGVGGVGGGGGGGVCPELH